MGSAGSTPLIAEDQWDPSLGESLGALGRHGRDSYRASMTAGADAAQRVRALLPGVLAGLVLTDVAGGLLDVAAGRSRPNDAWSSRATLCAPWPMIAFQASTTLVATRWSGAPSRVASGLLALGCGVSIASGFFDGQLARRDLSFSEVGFQMFLLGATGLLGGLAAAVAATK